MISSRALSAVQIELLFHYHGEAVDWLGNPGEGEGGAGGRRQGEGRKRREEGGGGEAGGGRREEGGWQGGEIKAKFGKLS